AAEAPKTTTPVNGVCGGCLCGAVTFETAATPRRVANCYCSLCRRRSGAGFASTLFAPVDSFRWRSGQERVRHYALPAPRTYAADFCVVCGSSVPLVMAGSPLALLPAGAIDTPLPRLPAVHLYVDSKAGWCEIGGADPQFAELPPPERFTELFQ
ncbi:MAG TPA: GFA family protein, partial [Gammaproteobacteria bacterium]|nr:GFA family protein [Gammaproteobacteria bacterium]